MSNAEHGLLTSEKDEGTHVWVRHVGLDHREPARVTEDGIVRERNGPAPYSDAMYEVVDGP